MAFIPLNVKSEYTFLSSAVKVEKYISCASKLGFNMVGICDIDCCYSYPSFVKECNKAKIKPILGVEINISYKEDKRSICLFVKNEEGYKNLCNIISKIDLIDFSNGFFSTEGLICIIPSLSGNWFRFPINHQTQREFLYNIQKLFKDFYIGTECYSKSDSYFLNKIYSFADDSSIKTVAFPKVVALNKKDGLTLEILDAIKNSTTLSSFEENDTPFFLLSEKSARKIYRKEDFEFFDNFNCDFNLFQKRGKILSRQGITNKKQDLYEKCIYGLKTKNVEITDKIKERLNYELSIIENMKYLDYFYIVKDYVKYAKNNNIYVGPGRGSAAGSLVSYALDITDINPFDYDLLFERFLNPERVTMPDIDIDFSDYRRDEIITHIGEIYGKSRVKNIITFQTIGAKQAIRDIGRVFSLNPSDINNLCNSIKLSSSFKEAYNTSEKFRDLIGNNHYKSIASLARKIEGYPRQKGLHAAGVIINDEPLNNVLPIFGDENSPAPFEAPFLEELNFLKMDILGLRNLSIIESIVDSLSNSGVIIDLKTIPLNDKRTFDVLNEGFTKGIFQLESEGITKALKEIHIDSFNDIVALNALYRPGPMDNISLYAKRKKGIENIEYLDDRLIPILSETFGIIVYQEQIMQIALKIASFSLGKADLLRRAISKKDESKLKTMEEEFINGAINNNIPKEKAKTIYNYIYKFADYGFNKSHSVSYSYISYQLAYLKANYPTHFYSTMFKFATSSDSKFLMYLNELDYFDIKILPPDLNKSEINYTIEDNSIRLPLSGINSLSSNIVKEIVENRNKLGLFKDYKDAITRLTLLNIDKNAINLLINSGALDFTNLSRETMRHNLSNFMLYAESIRNNPDLSEAQLFLLEPMIAKHNDNKSLNYKLELSALGILLSGSLFENYKSYFKDISIKTIEEIQNMIGKNVNVPAIVSSIRIIETKNNKQMAILNCYDDKNSIKVVVFSNAYEEMPLLIKGDAIILKGYLNKDDVGTSFIASKIIKLEEEKDE